MWWLWTALAWGGDLDATLGRTEVVVRSAAWVPPASRTVADARLPERMEALGYTRVRQRPTAPGEWFWGTDVVWMYRRATRADGRDHAAALVGLTLREGAIVGAIDAEGHPMSLDRAFVEPEVLAESWDADRTPRIDIDLGDLPEHVWRPFLALEDTRFFEHRGVDPVAVARAVVVNTVDGEVSQGGSTITQQLVKNRDLTPERTLERKASEAARAVWLEARYSKEAILEAYLDTVYFGHVDGVGVYGLGTAARVFFDADAGDLSLGEAAVLAAVVQGPNGLSPIRHPEAATARRDLALSRMEELGWATAAEVAAAKEPLRLDLTTPARPRAVHLVDHVHRLVVDADPERVEAGLGAAVDTTVDPWLQARAERAVSAHLADLRRVHPDHDDLSVALVAVDARTGAALAWVGGDPAVGGLDRVARAARQPGSAVKPFVLLEALDDCGARDPLTPATRVADAPLTLATPQGDWSPANHDGRFHGPVSLRQAIERSYNVPVVRTARWCGFDAVAATFADVGLPVGDAPPSLVLGTVETTPLALAGAYTVFVDGRIATPYAASRIERPGGAAIVRSRADTRRVATASAAWVARDVLRGAVRDGTGTAAAIPGAAGKTGTTQAGRDAWFAGEAAGIVTVVWVGRDGGGRAGLSGGRDAAPLWKAFMADAVGTVSPPVDTAPWTVVERPTAEGLLTSGGEPEVFRRGHTPPRDGLFRTEPAPVIE